MQKLQGRAIQASLSYVPHPCSQFSISCRDRLDALALCATPGTSGEDEGGRSETGDGYRFVSRATVTLAIDDMGRGLLGVMRLVFWGTAADRWLVHRASWRGAAVTTINLPNPLDASVPFSRLLPKTA